MIENLSPTQTLNTVETAATIPTLKFHFILVVWGDDFTDMFLKVALPTQLSSGNLPAFKDQEAIYKIYTTPQDAERIRQSPAYNELTKLMPCEIILLELGVERYTTYRLYHAQAVQAASGDHEVLIFLFPDTIWSDGSFANLLRVALSGKRVVVVGSFLFVAQETFIPAFLSSYPAQANGICPVSARELVKLSLNHLLPWWNFTFWGSEHFRWSALAVSWRVGQEGLLIRNPTTNPIMMRPYRRNVAKLTIEGDYLTQEFQNLEDYYYVENSDEMFLCSIDPMFKHVKRFLPLEGSKDLYGTLKFWQNRRAYEQHLYFFKHKNRLQTGERSTIWEQYEQESDAVVADILTLVESRTQSVNFRLTHFYLRQVTQIDRIRRALYLRVLGLAKSLRPKLPRLLNLSSIFIAPLYYL